MSGVNPAPCFGRSASTCTEVAAKKYQKDEAARVERASAAAPAVSSYLFEVLQVSEIFDTLDTLNVGREAALETACLSRYTENTLSFGRIIPTTLLWAARLCGPRAWV